MDVNEHPDCYREIQRVTRGLYRDGIPITLGHCYYEIVIYINNRHCRDCVNLSSTLR